MWPRLAPVVHLAYEQRAMLEGFEHGTRTTCGLVMITPTTGIGRLSVVLQVAHDLSAGAQIRTDRDGAGLGHWTSEQLLDRLFVDPGVGLSQTERHVVHHGAVRAADHTASDSVIVDHW